MELAEWNQLLASEDFPTGPGLGTECHPCRRDSWPDCPPDEGPAAGERAAASPPPPTPLTGAGTERTPPPAPAPLSSGLVAAVTAGWSQRLAAQTGAQMPENP